MNDLQIFNNPQFGEVRTITEDGVTLFCGSDVAKALGYKKPQNAIATHCKGALKRGIPTNGGIQEMLFIPEGDIYRLAARSELPGADAFERWIFDEVLPSIRKTGAYLTPELAAALADLPAMMELLAGLEERLSALEQADAGAIRPSRLFPAPKEADAPPGLAAKKRWMRTVSDKLDLLEAKFVFTDHNDLLHRLYLMLEEQHGVSLAENRIEVMEKYNLSECSVLASIFYNPDLREAIQRNIDYNLAPENRGW